ncbi:MAG: zf-TFIIB domain-containing protein [Chloroflexota bacterium]|nr:zf-TFIIB domain-containing protein [Chloroflexota bacterium]
MLCPIDQTELKITDRQGIEIDYCPTCRGVWLDRGELDKIIERAPTASTGPAQGPYAAPYPERRGYDYDDDDDDRHRYAPGGREGYYGHRRKRRESWLSDLFDF